MRTSSPSLNLIVPRGILDGRLFILCHTAYMFVGQPLVGDIPIVECIGLL
jgi:hypothetical protein